MCFINDYDWYASVTEKTSYPVEKETRCDECDGIIPVGATVHHIYQQEAEECRACEFGDCQCVGDCCQCAKPDPGETFDYDRCQDCHRFLEAVEAAEVEAGCSIYEARPPLGQMTEKINDGGRDEAKKYFKKAAKLHPELVKSGYLGWLWREMFGR